jgi:hypothetical protein
MKLYAALGTLLMYTSADAPKIGAPWTKAIESAESLDDPEYQSDRRGPPLVRRKTSV